MKNEADAGTELEKKLACRERQLEELKADYRQLHIEYARLLDSFSWKSTAPLRAAAKGLRRSGRLMKQTLRQAAAPARRMQRRLHRRWNKLLFRIGAAELPESDFSLQTPALLQTLEQCGKPAVLFVEHALAGGVGRHTAALAEALQQSLSVLFLRPAGPFSAEVILSFSKNGRSFALRFDSARELDELIALLKRCRVTRVHLHHILGFQFDVQKLVRALGVPFDFTVHDYYTICPFVALGGLRGKYCGERGIAQCNDCIAQRREKTAADILLWRQRHSWLLLDADRVICPSADTARRMRRYHPAAPLLTVAHDACYRCQDISITPCGEGEPLRIAVIGVLAEHKGARLVLETARLAQLRGLPFEFKVIGYAEDASLLTHLPNVTELGRYREEELPKLLAETAPHVAWFPSQLPETYSYTLSSALEAKLPIVAAGLGSFPERLRGRRWTLLTPPNAGAEQFAALFQSLRQSLIAQNPPAQEPVSDEIGFCRSPAFYSGEYLSTAPRIQLSSRRKVGLLMLEGGETPSPCAYIRCLLPLSHPALSDLLEIRLVKPGELSRQEADFLLCHRISVSEAEDIAEVLEFTRTRGVKLIYDIDDDLFDLPKNHHERNFYRRKMARVQELLSSARVWTSTPYLQQKLLQRGAHAALLENALDERIWGSESSEIPGNWDEHTVRILYMGTCTHNADFALVQPALKRLKHELGDRVEIDVIGVTTKRRKRSWFNLVSPGLEQAPSYPVFVAWLRRHNRYNIGIAPLLDSEANQAKSCIKFYDYSALGLTTAASDSPVYRPAIEDGVNGILIPDDPELWYKRLLELVRDSQARISMRCKAYRDFHKKYTLSSQESRRIELIKALSIGECS